MTVVGMLLAVPVAPPTIAIVDAEAADVRVLRHDREAARLINSYRARHGLDPVAVDGTLTRIAVEHARDLAGSGLTGHIGSDSSDPADRAVRGGYRFRNIGENASAGRTELGDVIRAWIRSPTHRANMVLNPATDFGLAHVVAPGTRYTHYWVLMVGARRPAGAAATGVVRPLGNGFTGGFTGQRRRR